MSQIARVFVVLNLILAAGFMCVAGAFLGHQADWKGKHEKEVKDRAAEKANLEQQLNASKREVERLNGDLTATKEKSSNFEGANGRLDSENKTLKTQIADKDTQIAAANKNVADMNETMKRMQDERAKLTEANTKLGTDILAAQDNERKANAEVAKMKDSILAGENKFADLEKQHKALADAKHEADLLIEIARKQGIDFSGMVAMESISDARVVGVDMSTKLVQVNVGANRKVSRGYVFDLVRGSSYIGRMSVDNVSENTASGTLKVLKQGETVMVGDLALNTLN